jgi:hypothetical protein
MILHRTARFEPIAERVVFYDEEPVRKPESQDNRIGALGLTHRTRNIGLLVALKDQANDGAPPVIVATTHLFWHGL